MKLDVRKLHAALDAKRLASQCPNCGEELSWRAVARQLGMNPSTFSRIARQQGMAADTLMLLLNWLGETDLKPYISQDSPSASEVD